MTTIRKTKSRNAQSVPAAARDLRGLIRGAVLLPGDEAYVNARQTWNGAVEHRPALFARCKTVGDVQTAVRVARTHGLPPMGQLTLKLTDNIPAQPAAPKTLAHSINYTR